MALQGRIHKKREREKKQLNTKCNLFQNSTVLRSWKALQVATVTCENGVIIK